MSSPDAASGTADSEVSEAESDVEEPEAATDTDEDAAEPAVERWKRFAASEPADTADEPEPGGGWQRLRRKLARAARGEIAIVAAISVALSLAMNWKVLRDPAYTIPHDLGDPLQQAYTLAWPGSTVLSDPGHLWNASNFYGESYSFVFSDTLLGYLPASLLGSGHAAALLRYNIIYLLTFALAFFGAYVLLRQLGSRIAGSAVGAAAFAYAPWKLAHEGHLNILSAGGIVLALAMLARGHGYSLRHGYRRQRTRWGWVVAGWLVASWQISIGFALGIPFGYLLAGIAVVSLIAWPAKRCPRVPWRVVVADAAGMVVFAGVSLGLALPYFKVLQLYPEAARPLDYVRYFSPIWQSFLISPEESALWGHAHAAARENLYWPPETTLLVGFTVLALAVAGLVWSSWSRWQRAWLFAGLALSVALALGTNFVDDGKWMYVLAYQYLPGFDGLRTPGRLVLYVSLLLAILAAGTLTRLADRLDSYALADRVDTRWRAPVPAPMRLALLIPVLFVLVEGYTAVPPPQVPTAPVALSSLKDPVLVLPSDAAHDYAVQYWTVDGFPRVVNGTSGFVPKKQEAIRHDALTFPSPQSVEALRADGVNTVVAVRDQLRGTPWEYLLDVPSADSSIRIEDRGKVIVFRL